MHCVVCVCIGIESRHLFDERSWTPPPTPLVVVVVVVAKGVGGWIDRRLVEKHDPRRVGLWDCHHRCVSKASHIGGSSQVPAILVWPLYL